MKDEKDLKNLFKSVDTILSKININEIDPNAPDFDNLPDGYYLCEVVKIELTTSKSGNPQVKAQFKSIENGKEVSIDEEGEATFNELEKTKDKMLFKYFPLTDENSMKKFIKDMLKFEGDEVGVPLLEKEYFLNSEVLEEALDVLEGSTIYIQISTSKNRNGESSTWYNLVSWSRATVLGLE